MARQKHDWEATHDVGGTLYFVCRRCKLGGQIDLPSRKKHPDYAEGIAEERQAEVLKRCDPDWLLSLEVVTE